MLILKRSVCVCVVKRDCKCMRMIFGSQDEQAAAPVGDDDEEEAPVASEGAKPAEAAKE